MINEYLNTHILNHINTNSIENSSNVYSLGNINHNVLPFLSYYLFDKVKKDTVLVVENEKLAESIYTTIKSLYSNINISYVPNSITEKYNMSPNKALTIQRLNALSNLTYNNDKPSLVIVSSTSYIQKTIPNNIIKNSILKLSINNTIPMDTLINFLIENNYSRTSLVLEEGEFAVRGDIIDLYTPNIGAIRIEFFDDTIEKIRLFDTGTQKTISNIEEIFIHPSSEIILKQEYKENFYFNYLSHFNERNNSFCELLESNILPKGIENYISLFYEKTNTITDYLNNPIIISTNNAIQAAEEAYKDSIQNYNYRKENKFEKNLLIPSPKFIMEEYNDNVKNKNNIVIYENKILENNHNINAEVLLSELELSKYKINSSSSIDALIKFIEDSNYSFVIFANSDAFILSLKKELYEKNISFVEEENYLSAVQNKVILKTSEEVLLHNGFIAGNICLITETDITGIKRTFKKNASKKKALINHMSSINPNNAVVHVKHGLGICQGIVTLKVNNIEHDFLEILYRDNDKLYIPVENLETVSKYSSTESPENLTLDKLGSNSFEKKQNKIKEKIKDIAYDLIQLAASREIKSAIKIPQNFENSNEYKQFCHDFPYVETEDQLKAINDIIEDFQAGKPADRLICGDVGFGKTEVAMRAAYMIAISGYQVAVMVPTTLLCNQHYSNFVKRFKNTPLNIKQLSKFVTQTEKKKIKEEIKNGSVDIVIGTHSLLSKDMKFQNLGLIIIDEEQNFGVSHKEKLKTLQINTHLITLSATPIPRTIQMAFKGIKELSLINTPPIEKVSISTYTMPYSITDVKYAIEKEINRGGQVYFVCPRISDVSSIQASLDKLDLDIKYTSVHGRLTADELENRMLDFQNKKYDVLLSTNIIESGLDLGNVNTIIIYNSNMFGLAQLYQLRGRVGRSSIKSYAYIFYKSDDSLTDQAEKRLKIIQSLDYLGASFALANYDLELRGSGDLLGEAQSGNVKEVGFDLYKKILQKEINQQKKKYLNGDESLDYYSFNPNINLNIPVLIPKNYISDMEASIEVYQRISSLESIDDIPEMKEELIDRFGKIPYQVENLFLSIKIKILCLKTGIDKINIGPKGVGLGFYNGEFSNPQKLMQYVMENKDIISMKPDGSLFYKNINENSNEQATFCLAKIKEIVELIQ